MSHLATWQGGSGKEDEKLWGETLEDMFYNFPAVAVSSDFLPIRWKRLKLPEAPEMQDRVSQFSDRRLTQFSDRRLTSRTLKGNEKERKCLLTSGVSAMSAGRIAL